MTRSNLTHRYAWKTIDYIGGGYVLQVKMSAEIQKTRNFKEEIIDAEILDIEEDWFIDVDTNHARTNISRPHQKHRIVHLSELQDINFTEFLGDAQLRALKGENSNG